MFCLAAGPLVHHSIMRSRQVENCLIVVGGRTSPGKPNTSFYALDFGIDALSGKITFSVQKGEKRALLNSESGCIRCQTVDLLEGDVSLAVQSSQREEEGSLMDYFKCDLTRDGVGITQIPLSFNHPARLSSITRWGSIKVLLSGGWQEGAAISAVQVYDGEEWTSLCDLAYPRFGHTSHVVDDRFLVLVGGVSHLTEELPDVAVLDLSSKEQRHFTLDLPPNSQRSDYMLFNHTSNLLTGEDGSSRIWIMGGGGNCFSFGSHFNAHPLTFDVAGVLI
ncbi:hypothetical protein RvY_09980-2 [Ramazzottius varieornatus]|uniref:Uncharacterized protein n=1 Tax=Ramazzottius varieornatus TaxID=947166 RepID=A0A1D1VDC9_RAMVA|nr:hypothetical protein RvY_09980-2 [Ramazzottius varieornatus]